MNVLFIHQNFPSQFVHLSGALAKEKGNRVVALAQRRNAAPDGVEVRTYTLLREPAQDVHPLLREEEGKVMRAEAVAAAAFALKREGFVPDVIVAHPGWGEALFIKDVFPQAKLVVYCEYYYAAEGQDVGFDSEMPTLTFEQRCRLRLRNSVNLLTLEAANVAISPTQWQRATFPVALRQKIRVIHEGFDFGELTAPASPKLRLAADSGTVELTRHEKVVTYVARNLEPVRGFHIFMRTVPKIMQRHPDARFVVVGGDGISYGQPPLGGTWREHFLREAGDHFDRRNLHFVGQVPRNTFVQLMKLSSVHLYWTVPFVLSWSMLEAAITGTPVIASATAPVLEFASDLEIQTTDFFDPQAFGLLADQILSKKKSTRMPKLPPALDRTNTVQRQIELITNI